MKTVNIYGEHIEGQEIEYLDRPYKNIIIVEDEKGEKHVIHKDSLDKNNKRSISRANVAFDLKGCQAHGRKGPVRSWKRRK